MDDGTYVITLVAPVRERGLKALKKKNFLHCAICRSREGAWIERLLTSTAWLMLTVAPVRERGLKAIVGELLLCTACVAPVRERGLKAKTLYNERA